MPPSSQRILRLATLSGGYSHDFNNPGVLIGTLAVVRDELFFSDGSNAPNVSVALLPSAQLSFARQLQNAPSYAILVLDWRLIDGLLMITECLFPTAKDQLHLARLAIFELATQEIQAIRNSCAIEWRAACATLLQSNATATMPFEFNMLLNAAEEKECKPIEGGMTQIRKLKQISLFGKIESKSAVLEIGGSRFFIVRMVCGDSILNSGLDDEQAGGARLASAHIMFEQSSKAPPLPLHCQITYLFESILVNQLYVFLHLDSKQIRFSTKLPDPDDPKSNIKKLLSYNANRSQVHPLDESTAEQFIAERRTLSTTFPTTPLPSSPRPPQPEYPRTKIITYTGRITKTIDADLSKYQLDHKHDLYLTYHPLLPTIERLLQPGVSIILHNIHTILFESADLGNPAPKRAILVACLNTTVEIEHMSQDHVPEPLPLPPSRRTNRDQMKQKWAGLNLMDLIVLDDLFQLFLGIDAHHPRESAVWFQLAKAVVRRSKGFTEWPKGAGDVKLGTVLAHQWECGVAEERYDRPFLVSVKMLAGDLAVENEEEMGVVEEYVERMTRDMCGKEKGEWKWMESTRGAGGSEYEFKVFGKDELGAEGCFLMGRIEWRNGGLWFTDSSGSDPILVVVLRPLDTPQADQDESKPWELGGWVVILEFEIVVEVLGVHHSNDATLPVLKRYIRCLTKDCLFKSWFVEDSVGCGAAVLEMVEVQDDMLEPVVIRVGHRSTPSLELGADGSLGVKGRLHGNLWRVSAANGKLQVVESFDNAICEVYQESMPFWPILEHDGYFLISNVRLCLFDGDEPNKTPSMYCRLTSFSKVTRIHSARPPNTQSTGHFDLTHHQPHLYLNPIPSLPQPFSIQHLHRTLSTATIPYKSFHPTLVSLRGTIVSKSFATSAPWDLHDRLPAIHLFNAHNVGIARYDRILVVKIADLEPNDDMTSIAHSTATSTLQVYLDVRNQVFELGVTPGTYVHIHRLGIKSSASTRALYGQSVSETSIQILHTSSATNSTAEQQKRDSLAQYFAQILHTLPRLFLVHVYNIPAILKQHTFTILCNVTHVEQVEMWCECTGCRVKLTSFESACACRVPEGGAKPPASVQGSAKVFVEDGSCEAVVLVETFEGMAGLFGERRRKRVEEAVLSAAGSGVVEWYRNPVWLSEEYRVRADTTCDDNGEGGGFESARKALHDAVEDVSFTADFVLCCRLIASSWVGDGEADEEAEEYDLRNLDTSVLYSRVGLKDLIRKQVKLVDGLAVPVWAPPRIVLHGFYVEAADAVVEASRLL
ncbi:hypothetical protein HDU98_001933 [Podochytrium sp. JEL0797]|nr:hypothetical protein HDU98_001933 [Podochytrium sp. JEL0797]